VNLLDDARGVSVNNTTDRILLTLVSGKAGNPTVRLTPKQAVKIGQDLMKKAYIIMKFESSFFTGSDN
jgi:hypothetical protein